MADGWLRPGPPDGPRGSCPRLDTPTAGRPRQSSNTGSSSSGTIIDGGSMTHRSVSTSSPSLGWSEACQVSRNSGRAAMAWTMNSTPPAWATPLSRGPAAGSGPISLVGSNTRIGCGRRGAEVVAARGAPAVQERGNSGESEAERTFKNQAPSAGFEPATHGLGMLDSAPAWLCCGRRAWSAPNAGSSESNTFGTDAQVDGQPDGQVALPSSSGSLANVSGFERRRQSSSAPRSGAMGHPYPVASGAGVQPPPSVRLAMRS